MRALIYTTIYALSDPVLDYEGSQFYIDDSMKLLQYLRPEKYSVLVCLSESQHGVTEIMGGIHEMFINEYWAFPDPPFPIRRPANGEMNFF